MGYYAKTDPEGTPSLHGPAWPFLEIKRIFLDLPEGGMGLNSWPLGPAISLRVLRLIRI